MIRKTVIIILANILNKRYEAISNLPQIRRYQEGKKEDAFPITQAKNK